MSQPTPKVDFQWVNTDNTNRVVADLGALDKGGAVLVEAPPGAGKSSLTVSVSKALTDADSKLRLPIVTQTNEQADDLVASLLKRHPDLRVTRLVGGAGGSNAMRTLAAANPDLVISSKHDDLAVKGTQVVVATARKWEFVRSGQQQSGLIQGYDLALIDEAYQMRSDALLGIATMFDRLMCVGDPGQLDPFTTIDDALWKGLEYAPSRTAMGTLSAFHPDLTPHQLPLSWRLPPSAAGIVSRAFYPYTGFSAGTDATQRSLALGAGGGAPEDDALDRAAAEGWAYVELPEKPSVRTDAEVATQLARLVWQLLDRGADVVDEFSTSPRSSPTGGRRTHWSSTTWPGSRYDGVDAPSDFSGPSERLNLSTAARPVADARRCPTADAPRDRSRPRGQEKARSRSIRSIFPSNDRLLRPADRTRR